MPVPGLIHFTRYHQEHYCQQCDAHNRVATCRQPTWLPLDFWHHFVQMCVQCDVWNTMDAMVAANLQADAVGPQMGTQVFRCSSFHNISAQIHGYTTSLL